MVQGGQSRLRDEVDKQRLDGSGETSGIGRLENE
jgi:hypothetical protein